MSFSVIPESHWLVCISQLPQFYRKRSDIHFSVFEGAINVHAESEALAVLLKLKNITRLSLFF